MAERRTERGWVAPELAEELPGLGVDWIRIDARPGRTPAPVRRRIRELAARIGGAKVVQMRQDAVPWAYRVLWRRLGVDPDTDRTPIERLMVQRLEHGGLPSQGMPADAAVVATLETGVPIVILDADAVDGAPGLRPARRAESLGDPETVLRDGEVVYADRERPLARLTGEPASRCAVTAESSSMIVCALVAAGVSDMAIEEALWIAAGMLETTGRVEESNRGGHRDRDS
jgi:DNA/RNA-binding domain of Phe-tRNA-synthetase-like protein